MWAIILSRIRCWEAYFNKYGMKYLVFPSSDPQTASAVWRSYREHVARIEPRLPSRVRSFASQEWYYDPNDHRCPHDAWLESLTVSDSKANLKSGDNLKVDITVRLLGAYHDRALIFGYTDVRSYQLCGTIGNAAEAWHGDWLVDEFNVTNDGFVTHEMQWSSGSTWYFESRDIEFSDFPL